jgi:hypothetical protein
MAANEAHPTAEPRQNERRWPSINLLKNDEFRSIGYLVTSRDTEGGDLAPARGGDGMLHLHRLQHEQRRPLFHHNTGLRDERKQLARHRARAGVDQRHRPAKKTWRRSPSTITTAWRRRSPNWAWNAPSASNVPSALHSFEIANVCKQSYPLPTAFGREASRATRRVVSTLPTM